MRPGHRGGGLIERVDSGPFSELGDRRLTADQEGAGPQPNEPSNHEGMLLNDNKQAVQGNRTPGFSLED